MTKRIYTREQILAKQARYKERYHNDPNFRQKIIDINKARYRKNKQLELDKKKSDILERISELQKNIDSLQEELNKLEID